MRLKIVTSRDDIEHLKLDFIPTVVVGFFQAGTEDIYMFQYYRLKKYFPMAEFIGCSSENNISNRVPFIDVDGSVPYLFMMIDIKREAFSIQIPTTYKELKLEADKKYSVMMLSSEYDKSIDEAVSHVQHKIGNNVYGAIAGSCLETDERASIFYNGEFIYGGTLFWLMDNAFYHLKGLSIHNFEPVGIDLTVTKVEEKTILEIEEKPALDVIESMMGTLTSESLSSFDHPFFIHSEEKKGADSKIMPLSTLRKINRSDKSLEFMRDVHYGNKLNIAIPLNRLGQEEMFESLIKIVEKESVCFLFSSFAFSRHWAEMEPLYLMHLTQMRGVEFSGLHTFGEIGTLQPNGSCEVQNQTLTFVTLNETR